MINKTDEDKRMKLTLPLSVLLAGFTISIALLIIHFNENMKMITVEDGGYVFLKKKEAVIACFMDNKKYDNCIQVYGTWKK